MVASEVRIKRGEETLKLFVNKSIGMLRNIFKDGKNVNQRKLGRK